MITFIDYDSLGCERSRFDKVFLSLASTFHSKNEVLKAEALIQDHIDAFVGAYPAVKRIFVDKGESISLS